MRSAYRVPAAGGPLLHRPLPGFPGPTRTPQSVPRVRESSGHEPPAFAAKAGLGVGLPFVDRAAPARPPAEAPVPARRPERSPGNRQRTAPGRCRFSSRPDGPAHGDERSTVTVRPEGSTPACAEALRSGIGQSIYGSWSTALPSGDSAGARAFARTRPRLGTPPAGNAPHHFPCGARANAFAYKACPLWLEYPPSSAPPRGHGRQRFRTGK